jgi:hypothetical protein
MLKHYVLAPVSFELVSYDESYGDYLRSMGIPFFIVPLIMGSAEVMTVKVTDDGHWNIHTKTGQLCIGKGKGMPCLHVLSLSYFVRFTRRPKCNQIMQ